jgi:hypothetical protein
VEHLALFWSLCLEVTRLGHAPFGSHGFYTRFLDDADPAQRQAGIECGHAYLAAADEVWVWTEYGVEGGMVHDVEEARRLGKPVFTPPTWGPALPVGESR